MQKSTPSNPDRDRPPALRRQAFGAAVLLVIAGAALLLVRSWLHGGGTARGQVDGPSSADRPVQVGRPGTDLLRPSIGTPATRRPARETAAAVAGVRVLVTDEVDTPLQGVRLTAYRDGPYAAAHTEADGRATVAGSPETVLVEARGFADEVVSLPSPQVDDELHVVLRPAGYLRGTVVFPDETPAADVQVYAHEIDGDSPDFSSVSRALAGERREHLVTADAAGRFLIPGLHQERRYQVVAGGPGFLSTHHGVYRASEDHAHVVVEAVYGAIVRFRCDGDVLRLPPTSLYTTQCWTAVAGMKPLALRRYTALLAGAPSECFSLPRPDQLLLFVGQSIEARVGPCTIQGDLPGYRLFSANFEVVRLSEGLEEVTIDLTDVSEGRGAILAFASSRRDDLGEPSQIPPGMLTLYAEDGRRQAYSIEPRDEASVLLEGVPFGTYTACFEDENRTWSYPSASDPSVRIDVTDRPAPFEVRLPELGSLRLSLRHADGEPYGGYLSYVLGFGPLQSSESGGASILSSGVSVIDAPPFLLRNLRQGVYTLLLVAPRARSAEASHVDGFVQLEVVRGRTTEVAYVVE